MSCSPYSGTFGTDIGNAVTSTDSGTNSSSSCTNNGTPVTDTCAISAYSGTSSADATDSGPRTCMYFKRTLYIHGWQRRKFRVRWK
jgi:hypothetical protein